MTHPLAALIAGVKVKPLEWTQRDGIWTARTAFGTSYDVCDSEWCYVPRHVWHWEDNDDAAKAAAQADYEARIRAALEAAEPLVATRDLTDEEAAALRAEVPGQCHAMPAAMPADVAGVVEEAGKVEAECRAAVSLEGPRAANWSDKPHRVVFDLCQQVRALIALATAQAAQIAGLEQKVNGLCDLYSQASVQVQSAGAALAAERAKVERLTGALSLIESMSVHSGGEIHGVTAQHWKAVFEEAQEVARAALSEAEART